MTLNQIAKKVALIEGQKSQARIGDVREILKILVDADVKGMIQLLKFEKGLADTRPIPEDLLLNELQLVAEARFEKELAKLNKKLKK